MTQPFVNFKMEPTGEISSTETLIFGNDQHTCLVEGVVLSNLTEQVILVTLSLAREEVVGEEALFVLASEIPIEASSYINVLSDMTLILEPGDLLYAHSDYSDNLFNAFVNYRELTEI